MKFKKPPWIIIIITILLALVILANAASIFVSYLTPKHPWSVEYYVLATICLSLSLLAFWKMKRWGLILYLGQYFTNIFLYFATYHFSSNVFLSEYIVVLPTLLAIIGLLSYKKLSKDNRLDKALVLSFCLLYICIKIFGPELAVQSHTYIDQFYLLMYGNMTRLSYNITAVAQQNPQGYGPAYLLNGLSNEGYWYQVGLSYNYSYNERNFTLITSVGVKGANNGDMSFLIMPNIGFLSYGNNYTLYTANFNFSKPVNPGDKVLISLYLKNGRVVMFGKDWNNGAEANVSYSALGANTFVGTQYAPEYSSNDVSTSLMTEWHHAAATSGSGEKVTYTPYNTSTFPKGALLISRFTGNNTSLWEISPYFNYTGNSTISIKTYNISISYRNGTFTT